MIRQVRLQNFKSWQETGSVRLAPLTCFFGTNSSGKSSLLQMLLLLKQTKESSDRSLILRTDWDNNAYINMGTIQELLHRSGQTTSHSMRFELIWDAAKPIVIRPDWKLEALQFSTEIVDEPSVMVGRFAYSGENFLAEMSLSDPIKKKYALKVLLNGEEPLVPQGRPRVHIGEPIKFYGFSDEALRVYANSGYLSDLVLSLETLLSSIYHLGPLRAYPERRYSWGGEARDDIGLRGENAVRVLLAKRQERVYKGNRVRRVTLEERIAEWLKEMGMVASFRTERIAPNLPDYRVLMRRYAYSPEVPLTDVGIGISQVLPVLVLCYTAPSGSTVLLEQPEIHLHPAVQSVLADVLIDVVTGRNVQLIVESHSEHLLGRLQRRIAEQKLSVDKTAFYFCDNVEGVSNIRALEVDMFGTIRNWPQDFFGNLTGDLVEQTQASIRRQMAHGSD